MAENGDRFHYGIMFNYVVRDYLRRPARDGVAPGSDGCYLYVILSSFAGENGECWPSLDTLQDMSGLSRPTVLKALKRLTDVELLKQERRKAENGKDLSTMYTVCYPEGRGKLNLPSPPIGVKEIDPLGVKEIDPQGKARLPKEDTIEEPPLEEDPKTTLFDPPAKKARSTQPAYTPEFNLWMETYPFNVKSSKGQTFKAWRARQKDLHRGNLVTVAMLQKAAINARAYYEQVTKEPTPSQWFLNQDGEYLNHIDAVPPVKRNGNGRYTPPDDYDPDDESSRNIDNFRQSMKGG